MSLEKNSQVEVDKKIKLNPEDLRKSLIDDISKEFSIREDTSEFLLGLKTEISLEGLRSSIRSSSEEINDDLEVFSRNINDETFEKLLSVISGAKELIRSTSEIKISSLKKEISGIDDIGGNGIEKYLPKSLVSKAINPQNINDHILGFSLGTASSIYTTVEALYNIGKGMIQTPVHLYMIIRGQAEVESFKSL